MGRSETPIVPEPTPPVHCSSARTRVGILGQFPRPSTNILVSPAAPFRLNIQTQPSSTAPAGQPFPAQPVIDELDLFGNLETTDNSTLITASLDFGNGPLLGTATATLVDGVATFINLADSRAETIQLEFSSGSLTPATSRDPRDFYVHVVPDDHRRTGRDESEEEQEGQGGWEGRTGRLHTRL